MKREEIEGLLASYANGSLRAEEKLKLEELFNRDAALKEEADELLATWQLFDKQDTPSTSKIDARFKALLQEAKDGQLPTAPRVIQLKVSWLKTVAAVAACIAAFMIGKYSTEPVEVIKYKTVVVKAPDAAPKPETVSVPVAAAVKRESKSLSIPKEEAGDPVLAQQLRWVYASERIGAVMRITGRGRLSDADLQQLDLALREDPSPNVRLAILDALRPLATRANVQAVLINVLKNRNDDLIKSSVVDLLIDTKSRQAIPQMIAMLDDENTTINMQNKIKAGIESFLN